MFDISHPVTGENFIGREEELRDIKTQIFDAAIQRNPINFSLTGNNRIGKTSLIREACRRFDEQPHPNTVVLTLSLEGTNGFWKFWALKVIGSLFKKLDMKIIEENREDLIDELLEIREYFKSEVVLEKLFNGDVLTHELAKIKINDLFALLTECDIFVILIIDEFDLSNRVFGDHKEEFNWLRGLLQEGHYLTVVTVSRRELYYIETSAFGGSTLHGTFTKYGLYGFNNNELKTFFDNLEGKGYPLNDKQRSDIVYYCGRSPYFLAIMGNSIMQAGTEIPSIQQLFEENSRMYYDSFESTIKVLKEENLLQAMLQMFIGPNYNLQSDDIARLIGMGYCQRKSSLPGKQDKSGYEDIYHTYEEDSAYITICNSFIDYLATAKEKDVNDIYPKLHKVERGLRDIARNKLIEEYKDDWKAELLNISDSCLRQKTDGVKRIETRNRFYQQYKNQHQQAENPEKLDDSILHVISFTDLGDVIVYMWDKVKDIFKVEKKVFSKWMTKIQNVRNPYAHSNAEVVTSIQLKEVDDIINNILHLLDKDDKQ